MPDIRELPAHSRLDVAEPYRVYELLPPVHKDDKIRRRVYKRPSSSSSTGLSLYGNTTLPTLSNLNGTSLLAGSNPTPTSDNLNAILSTSSTTPPQISPVQNLSKNSQNLLNNNLNIANLLAARNRAPVLQPANQLETLQKLLLINQQTNLQNQLRLLQQQQAQNILAAAQQNQVAAQTVAQTSPATVASVQPQPQTPQTTANSNNFQNLLQFALTRPAIKDYNPAVSSKNTLPELGPSPAKIQKLEVNTQAPAAVIPSPALPDNKSNIIQQVINHLNKSNSTGVDKNNILNEIVHLLNKSDNQKLQNLQSTSAVNTAALATSASCSSSTPVLPTQVTGQLPALPVSSSSISPVQPNLENPVPHHEPSTVTKSETKERKTSTDQDNTSGNFSISKSLNDSEVIEDSAQKTDLKDKHDCENEIVEILK